MGRNASTASLDRAGRCRRRVDSHPTPAPGARDISSHARFGNLTTSPPTPGTTNISSHEQQSTPAPITGTRIVTAPSAPRLDPPPH